MEEDLEFGKKVSINDDTMEVVIDSTKIVVLLRSFLDIQQRRAQAYSKLKRFVTSFFYGKAFVLIPRNCTKIQLNFYFFHLIFTLPYIYFVSVF